MLIVFAFALNNRKNKVESTGYVQPLASIATIDHRWTSRIIYSFQFLLNSFFFGEHLVLIHLLPCMV